MTSTNSESILSAKTIVVTTAILLIISTISTVFSLNSSRIISSGGLISYLPRVNVYLDPNRVVATNRMSLGMMLDYEWKIWRDRPVLRQMTTDAGFRLVRLFDRNPIACNYWNETTNIGTFVWSNVDSLVQSILDADAEPLICLGFCGEGFITIPSGMVIESATGLPRPESWAAYCKEWIKHFKNTGSLVRFYETMNEPWLYFGWNDYVKIANFMRLFNAAATAMRTENPNILLGFDGTNRKPVLDFWLANGGANLDFISFHKYDAGTIGRYTDEEMFDRAESNQLVSSSSYYGIKDARQVYYDARGKWILTVNSESNFNSACNAGTDPKIQQIVGAVWVSLVLRKGVLEGLDYSVYYGFSSSASWERANKPSGGVGFGMVNHDNNKPWYPYFVNKLIGTNLAVGDEIVESNCSSSDLRSLAWIHEGSLKLILISRVDQPRGILLQGTSGQIDMSFVDSTISWETPALQNGTADSTDEIQMSGYTVMLIEF